MANMKLGTRLRCSVEEEAAAALQSLEGEAAKLQQVVSVFHLQRGPARTVPRGRAPAVPRLLA